MANFLQMLKLFASETGRHDLVVDFAGGNYSDNGAGIYINAGQRMLDRRFFDYVGSDDTYVTTLAVGGYQVEIPAVRAINSVWFRPTGDTGANRTKLTKKTKEELRDIYRVDFSQVDNTEPFYFSRTGKVTSTAAPPGTYINLDQSMDANKILLLAFYLQFDMMDENEDEVVTQVEAEGFDPLFGDDFYGLFDIDPAGTTKSELLDVLNEELTLVNPLLLTYSTDNLLILPPTDSAITIEIDGKFYSSPLINPTDESRWSKQNPDALNLAAQYKHEISQGDKSKANDLRDRLNEVLAELNLDAIDEEDVDDDFIQIEG